jgi:ferrous iron transport protein B
VDFTDAATTQIALAQLDFHDTVLLVVKATHVDEDLADLLPLVAGKRGIVVIPFWDKVSPSDFTRQVIRQWERTSNLAIIPVDARHLTTEQRRSILAAIDRLSAFPDRWQPDLA